MTSDQDPLSATGAVLEAYLDAEEARARWEAYRVFHEAHSRLWRPLRLLWWRVRHRTWLREWMPRWRRAWRRAHRLDLLQTGGGFALCSVVDQPEAYRQGVGSMSTFSPLRFTKLVEHIELLVDPDYVVPSAEGR